MDDELKYHNYVKDYKNYSVSIQCYELALMLRTIETKYFKVSQPSHYKLKLVDNYTGFNKDELIDDFKRVLLSSDLSIEVKRDIKIKYLLGEEFLTDFF